jgi:competence protein ComEC
LLISPDLLFDVGFQLSFLSVASMLLFADSIAGSMKCLPASLRSSLGASLSAQILPLPAAVHAFHVLPLAAPLANLIVVPLLAVVLWLTFLTVVAGAVSTGLAAISGHALAFAVYAIRAVAQGVSSMHGSRLTLASPALPAIAAYAAAAWMLWSAFKRTNLKRGLLAILLFVAAGALWQPFHRPAELVFLDVGAGDSAFVCTTGGSTLLIDGGDRIDRNGRERVVVPYLQSNRVARLDALVASHSDRDHTAGLCAVLENFEVGTLFLAGGNPADEAEKPLLGLCARYKVPVRRLVRGDTVNLAGGKLITLYPGPEGPVGEGINNRSLVVRLEWAGPSVLFPGDIQAEAESSVAATDCRADLLKVPHHGSNTSSTEPFIQAVAPKDCIVSTGLLRGRPLAREEILSRYDAHDIGIWRTDYLGGIRLTLDKTGYRLEGARPARGYPVPLAPGRKKQ